LPSQNLITKSLIVRELVRPFSDKQLKEFLEKFGKLDKFWLHPLKTHAYFSVFLALSLFKQ